VATSRQQREAREARDRLKAYSARQEVHSMQKRRRLRDNIIAVIGIVVVAALATLTQVVYFTAGPGVPSPAPSASENPADANLGAPDPSLAEGRVWTGTLTLNDIALGISLDGAVAPQAVSGWIQDVQSGYYTDKTCHRMGDTPGFELLQCGSIDGVGGPDPAFHYGPVENAPADNVYPAGTIAMARAGDDAYSNGHQFFLVTGDTTLPTDTAGGYTVVGTVTSGLDQLIASIMSQGIDPATVGQDGTGNPLVPTVIRGVTLQ
jgi:peptidyl-prolyl cis-trans isomerase B (cyclophilin B)